MTKKKRISGVIAKILIINTLLTFFMFYLVLRKNDLEDFFDVFAISLITAVSVFMFAKSGVALVTPKSTRQNIIHLGAWCISGSLTGSVLSSLFFYLSNGVRIQPALAQVCLYTFVFGMLFEVVLLYYFYSRKAIDDSEKRIQAERIRRLTLEKESAINKLKLLQAQIEPHFLFNTLSNVSALFETDPEKAMRMLDHLNDYLQIALQRTRQETITLSQELELIQRYLEIVHLRMGKRLVYDIKKCQNCDSISFPPMLIHPLVENAVKHGLEPKKDGGSITILCRRDQNWLTITVSDTGAGIDTFEESRGIGLDNISQRIEHIYGDRAQFILKENKPSGLNVIVELPIQ